MNKQASKKGRDITKRYPLSQIISKLRRLADGLETGKNFSIQIAGQRIRVPKDASVTIEHEKSKTAEEIEFQITWKP